MARFTAVVDGMVMDDGRTLLSFPPAEDILLSAPPVVPPVRRQVPALLNGGVNKRSEATVRCAELKRLKVEMAVQLTSFRAQLSGELTLGAAAELIERQETALRRELEEKLEKHMAEWRARQLAKARAPHEALADAPLVNLLH